MSAYNAENTIRRAISSVLNQTHKNVELVIVNDSSTDKTLDIINSFVDDRIKVINHTENLGAGWARYNGIKQMTGEYNTFCDSDDELLPDTIETLLKEAVKKGVDIVSPGYTYHSLNGPTYDRLPDKDLIREGSLMKIDNSNTLHFININLIKSYLWGTVDYSKRRFVEDTPTFMNILQIAKGRSIIPFAGYQYYQTEGSLCESSTELKKEIFSCLGLVDNYDFFVKHKPTEVYNIVKTLEFRLARMFQLLYSSMEDKSIYKEELTEVLQFYKQLVAQNKGNEKLVNGVVVQQVNFKG